MDWEEARTDEKGKPAGLSKLPNLSFLTSGFAMDCIMLSTRQQSASLFRYLGKQASKPYAHLIAFAQKPGTGIPGLFRAGEIETHFLSQGIAWIDPANLQVMRIKTDLLEPLPQLGLTHMTTEISYGDYRFGSTPRTFWLPREVVVTFRYGGRDFRNTHRYSDYRLFSVESYEKTEPVRSAPASDPHLP